MIIKLIKLIKQMRGERGVTVVEYALLVTLVGIVAIISIQVVGGELEKTFSAVGTALEESTGEGTPDDDYGYGCSRRR